MKAHGIAPNAASVRASPAARTFKTEHKGSPTSAKKRKMDDFANDRRATADDDETFEKLKSDPGSHSEQLQVKEEPNQTLVTMHSDNMPFMPSMSDGSQNYLSANNMFDSNTVGFSTNPTDSNVYGLPHDGSFVNFNTFEQANTNDPGPHGDQVGDREQDSIIIAD